MAIDIGRLFERYGWAVEQVDDTTWRSNFVTASAEEFDLYVMVGEEWVHFAVSPFLPPALPECRTRVQETLLRLNQQMRLVYFGIDDDGDVNLLAELPQAGFSFRQFALALDAMALYTERLAYELARLATEPGYHSPLLPVV
jgi:hypothetical protein